MNRKDKRFALLLKLPLYLWTVLFVLAAQTAISGLWCLAANQIYFKLYKPIKTLVIYKDEEDLEKLNEIVFFENRFDRQTRLIMSGLFLVFYLLIVIPTALYTGAFAFNKIFNLETIFGLSYAQAIVYTVIAIGVVGAIYAILAA